MADRVQRPDKESSEGNQYKKKAGKVEPLEIPILKKQTHLKIIMMTTTMTYFRCGDITVNNLVKNPSPLRASILFQGESKDI